MIIDIGETNKYLSNRINLYSFTEIRWKLPLLRGLGGRHHP